MQITDLIRRFQGTREKQEKAVFSTLCIAENRLQTVFDKSSPDITLKQFMLLTMVRQSKDRLTFTDDKRAAWLVPAAGLDEYFEQIAAIHRRKLSCLFRHYTDQEMEQLFTLLMKLYDGIDGLEAAEEAMKETT